METTTTTPHTLFLHDGTWFASVRTACGFRHVKIGRVTGLTRRQAEARAEEVLAR